ncbi:MAG: VOC family protein [Corynebacterium sp.]|uniref:VOC family protein n=1 Tax=Corynebacterium sp. TaxID=1720 RepID=UPI0026DC5CBD|nr:VOC family protein [Corynebacterium sp.]MDO5098351.1 VOC family protein [Corynebacterium sp.]
MGAISLRARRRGTLSVDFQQENEEFRFLERSFGQCGRNVGLFDASMKFAHVLASRGDHRNALIVADGALEQACVDLRDAARVVEAFSYLRTLVENFPETVAELGWDVPLPDYGIYIHALLQLPEIPHDEVDCALARMKMWAGNSKGEFCNRRNFLTTKFWVHHLRGESHQAAETFTTWEAELSASSYEVAARVVIFEILMLNALGRFEQALDHAGDPDERSNDVNVALIEAYTSTGKLIDAATWALYSLGDREHDDFFHHYAEIARLIPLLPEDLQKYLQCAAHYLYEHGDVCAKHLKQLRAIYAGVANFGSIPELSENDMTHEAARLFVAAFYVISRPDASVDMREDVWEKRKTYGDEVGLFLWRTLVVSLVRDTQGDDREYWFSEACDACADHPQLIMDVARWCVDNAGVGQESRTLWLVGNLFTENWVLENSDLPFTREVYQQCEEWIRRAGELEHKADPENQAKIAGRMWFDLARIASARKDWEQSREYLFQSVTHHISPENIDDLESELQRNPLVKKPTPDALDHAIAEHSGEGNCTELWRIYCWSKARMNLEYQTVCLQEIVEVQGLKQLLFEVIEPFQIWVDILTRYTDEFPRDFQEWSMMTIFPWYMWALYENPSTTTQGFYEALDHYEAIVLHNEHEHSSALLALARTFIAYRYHDMETAHEQRIIWCAPDENMWLPLRDVEAVYCIDELTRVGDYGNVLTWVRQSWGDTECVPWLKAALLESVFRSGNAHLAAEWFQELSDFSLAHQLETAQRWHEKYLAVAAEVGILRYLLCLVAQGEVHHRELVRRRVMSVLAVWEKTFSQGEQEARKRPVFYPRNVGTIASVVAPALRMCFETDDTVNVTLSVGDNEWLSVPDVAAPIAEKAAKWFEEIQHQVERLFHPDQAQFSHHVGIYVTDLDAVYEFFCKYFPVDSVGLYENPRTHLRSHYLMFDDGAKNLVYYHSPRLEILSDPNRDCAQNTPIRDFCLHVENREQMHDIVEKLRRDGYKILTEPHETSEGRYESTVLGIEEIPITLSAGLR